MDIKIDQTKPTDIERRSFEIIESELTHPLDPKQAPIIKRVIHATADFEYADTLFFSDNVINIIEDALKKGATIVTDTNMAKTGISKPSLAALHSTVFCYMADPDVAAAARKNGTTRAVAAMEKASSLTGPVIYVIGNAPTALIELCRLMDEDKIHPTAVIGVPVGFVNVVPSKELLLSKNVPCIVSRGRKGGSTVAAAIMNALLYLLTRDN